MQVQRNTVRRVGMLLMVGAFVAGRGTPSAAQDGASLQDYVGSYEVAPGVALEVTEGDDGLRVQAPGQQPAPMTAGTDKDTFKIAAAGATIVFSRDNTDQVVELVLYQAGNETRATKVE